MGLNMLCEELAANVVQRSKLEEIVSELEAANHELGAFSDALAHDLRSPLLIVTNFSHQLGETLGDSIGQQDADDLERIRFAGQHMMRIIDDLGDLGDVNRAEISRSEVDLSALGRHIIDELRASVPDRNVKFEAEPGVTAVGDMTLLRLLLRNLLQNAWKYTQPRHDARIEVGVVEDEGGSADLPCPRQRYWLRQRQQQGNFPSLRAAPYQDRLRRKRTRTDHRRPNRAAPRRTGVGRGCPRRGGGFPFHTWISFAEPASGPATAWRSANH